MDMNGALELMAEDGLAADEALLIVMEARKVHGPNWEPKKGSTGFKALEYVAQNPGMNLKQISAGLGLKRSGAYHALLGSQDAGLIASLGGKRGYVITDKGAQYARRSGIQVTGRVAPEMMGQATAAAAARKLPMDIEADEGMYKALGVTASSSPLGKRTRNIRPGDMGFTFKKVGNRADWTVTLAGKRLGAQYAKQNVWLRKNKGVINVLQNSSSVANAATSSIQTALATMGIQGGSTSIKVVGWQADASMTSGEDDVVVSFDSSLPPVAATLSKSELKQAKRRQPTQMMKRAQKLMQRASRKTRMGTLSRTMKVMKRLQK